MPISLSLPQAQYERQRALINIMCICTPTDISEGCSWCDRRAVLSTAGSGGAGTAGGDGDAGERGAPGSASGGGHPRAPGATLHRPQEDPGTGGKDLPQQE